VLYNALEAVRIVALFTAPVMPRTSAEVWRRLGLGTIEEVKDIDEQAAWGGMLMREHLVKGEALFPRMYEEG
jgi:methionyl-tRNA synthetase